MPHKLHGFEAALRWAVAQRKRRVRILPCALFPVRRIPGEDRMGGEVVRLARARSGREGEVLVNSGALVYALHC